MVEEISTSSASPISSARRDPTSASEAVETRAGRGSSVNLEAPSFSWLTLGAQIPASYLLPPGPGREKPLFSFGVITDVQYADIPDGKSFSGMPRFYRHSLEVLRRAVRSWNEYGGVSFSVHFGDIIDGFCPKAQSITAIKQVLHEFEKCDQGRVYHMLGNHCLYNLEREILNDLLQIPTPPDGGSYYDFRPHPGFRFIVLDGYDVSMLGWPSNHPHTLEAQRLLDQNNPNQEKNSPEGLSGPARRFVKFNGGVGARQLAWLDAVLQAADGAGEHVIVCCHLPLEPSSLPFATCLLWNYDQVLEVIHRYTCVVGCFSGHAHVGGYATDTCNVHHRVLEAALECPPGSSAFGRVDVFQDHMCLFGTDRMACTFMPFPSRECKL